jgi:hypothetical protein
MEDLAHTLKRSLDTEKDPRLHIEDYKKLLGLLHKYDFTAADYLELIKLSLIEYLVETKPGDPKQFSADMKILTAGNNEALTSFIENVYRQLGIIKMEGKVPVAVEWSSLE